MNFAKNLVFTLTFIVALTANQTLNALNPFSTGSDSSRLTACSAKTTIAALIVLLQRSKADNPQTNELLKNIEYSLKIVEKFKNFNIN